MKIAFVLKYFLPEKTAGTEVYAAALCHGLLQLNAEVVVIKPGIGAQDFNEYYYGNIRVLEYPESALVDKDLQTGKRKTKGLDSFTKLLLAEKPDIVHFHEITGSNGITIAHVRTAKEMGMPVLLTMHLIGYSCQTGMLRFKDTYYCNGVVETHKCAVCTLHKKGFRYGSAEVISIFGEWFSNNQTNASFLPDKLAGALSYSLYMDRHLALLTELFAVCEKVFVLSDWFKKVLLVNNLPENKMILLPKALPDDTVFEKRPYNEKKPDDIVQFVYLGRISRIKGLHTVLEALKKVKAKNWSLDIYGQVEEQAYFAKCNKMIKQVSGAINWKGTIQPKEVVKTLQQYDALIFPTIIQEMVGLVVQEAFAAGVPVIGSDAKGIAEQVTDNVDGLFYKAGDATALKNILNRVLSDTSVLPALAAGIKTPHLFNKVALQSLQVYQSVLQKRERTEAYYS